MRRMTLAFLIVIGLFSVSYIAAGPNRDELVSARCLVPDWSRTSGGYSADLSPDGKTLVYQSNDQVWVLPDVDKYTLEEYSSGPMYLYQPWPLEIDLSALKAADVEVESPTLWGRDNNVDWSPDGKSVAFVLRGRLFVADSLNSEAKTARIRLLADARVERPQVGSPYGLGVTFPRWSPDSTKICFFRRVSSDVARHSCHLSMVDAKSGIETVIARDARPSYRMKQPWSPDAKRVVYEADKRDAQGERVSRYLKVASVEGEKTEILRELPMEPAWSPHGDRIVWCDVAAPYDWGLTVADADGRNARLITQRATPEQQQAWQDAKRKKLREFVLREDNSWLSDSQMKSLKDDSMNEDALMDIAYIHVAARDGQLNLAFASRIEAIKKSYAATGDDRASTKGIADGYDVFGEEGQAKFNAMNRAYLNVLREAEGNNSRMVDRLPVWSPDGKWIAFKRSYARPGVGWDERHLMIVDTASGKERLLFTADDLSDIDWTADGRILVKVQRNLAVERFPDDPENFLIMSSYPEIWLIQPK